MSKAVISINSISKTYNNQNIFNQISLDIFENDFFEIKGINGSGKTTLCKILLGLTFPDSGKIQIRSGQKFGFVSNNNRSFYYQLTALENLLFFGRLSGYKSDDIQNNIKEIDTFLSIKNLLSKKFSALSDGEKKRISVARAILSKPNILLLDEPFNFLDTFFSEQLIEYLNIFSSTKSNVVIITSNKNSQIDSLKTNQFNLFS